MVIRTSNVLANYLVLQSFWTSHFKDGRWNIFMGLFMLTMGIRMLADNVWFTFVIWAAVLVLLVGKRLITTPRMGRVKFGPARKVKRKKVTAVITISVLATLLLLPLSGLVPATILGIWIPIMIALVLGLMAYYMDFGRLYAYGLLFATSMALTEALGLGNPVGPVALSVSGGIALLIGLVVLVRFLRKYPLPAEGAPDVD